MRPPHLRKKMETFGDSPRSLAVEKRIRLGYGNASVTANNRTRHIVTGNLDQTHATCKNKQIAVLVQPSKFHKFKNAGDLFRSPVASSTFVHQPIKCQ